MRGSEDDSRKSRLPHQNQRERARGYTCWRGSSGVVTGTADEGGVIDL
jgi:hypothetical protein